MNRAGPRLVSRRGGGQGPDERISTHGGLYHLKFDRHHPLEAIPVAIFKPELLVKLNGYEVCYADCQPNGVEPELLGLLQRQPRQFCADPEISVVLIDKNHKFTSSPLPIGNQCSMAYNTIASPCEKILSHFEKLLHPTAADFRVFGWEALGSWLRREHAVHFTKGRKIFSTTGPYFKGSSRLIGSGDALQLHNEKNWQRNGCPPILRLSVKKNILQTFGKGNFWTV